MFLFWNKQRLLGLIGFILLLMSAGAQSELRVSGFATLGMTSSNSDDLIYRSSLNRWPEQGTNFKTQSLLGLQMNYQLSDDIDVVVQGLLENKDYDNAIDYLELAFIRYQLNRNWSFRLGRMNYNAYMLSEYLEIGYSYIWATPPTEFYTTSSYLSQIDGGEIQYRNSLETGVLQATFAIGTNDADLLDIDQQSSLAFKHVVNTTVSYETNHWLFKASVSQFTGQRAQFNDLAQLENVVGLIPEIIWPDLYELIDSLDFRDEKMSYVALGVNYNRNNFFVKSELAHFGIDWGLVGDLGYGYVSVGYEFDQITPYFTFATIDSLYDRVFVEEPRYDLVADPLTQYILTELHSVVQRTYDTSRIEQSSITLGVRWDFTSNWALKAQVARYRINGPGFGLWGANADVTINGTRNINVIDITLNTVF